MLAYVTSLPHPEAIRSYRDFISLVNQTLRSFAVHEGEFTVIVVGNTINDLDISGATEFIGVDHPPAQSHSDDRIPIPELVKDKGAKIAVGIGKAIRDGATHVAVFDSDDFMSRKLTRLFSEPRHVHDDRTVWRISRGWWFSHRREVVKPLDGFDQLCGSSYILPVSIAEPLREVSPAHKQSEVISIAGDMIDGFLGRHKITTQWMQSRNIPVREVPFRAAMYRVDTGFNVSDSKLPGFAIPMSGIHRREFGIVPSQSAARRMWNAIGPKAAAASIRGRALRVARSFERNVKQ